MGLSESGGAAVQLAAEAAKAMKLRRVNGDMGWFWIKYSEFGSMN
jgi:hypothetical protein